MTSAQVGRHDQILNKTRQNQIFILITTQAIQISHESFCFLDLSQKWKPVGSTGTGRVDRHRSGRPAGRVEILRPAGQAG